MPLRHPLREHLWIRCCERYELFVSPVGAVGADQIRRAQTERSHEENQERAYIAASRRSDRSIEARVQSARMASEIHKKRTGKGFKVSEEIVMKEEMYEEEEDDLPRQFRSLTSHLPSNSPVLASRLNAYVSTQVAMHSALAVREREIEKQFAEQFPHYQAALSQGQQSAYMPPYPSDLQRQTSPTENRFSHHRHSMDISMAPSPSPTVRHASLDGGEASRPVSVRPESPHSNRTPLAPSSQQQYQAVGDAMSSSKYFTAELPNDVKQLASLDWNDPMTPALYGISGSLADGDGNASNTLSWTSFLDPAVTTTSYEQPIQAKVPPAVSSGDYFNGLAHPTSHHLELPGGQSTIGTPGGGVGGDPWDIWIDSDSYGPDMADKR